MYTEKKKKLEEEMTSLTGELMRGIRDVKALNAETTALHKMSERIDRTNYGKYKELVVRWRHWFVANSCETLFGLLFFVLAIVLLRHNLVTMEDAGGKRVMPNDDESPGPCPGLCGRA